MNFFESQERARKSTAKLTFLFILAVVSLIIMTNLLVMVVFGYLNFNEKISTEALIQTFDWQTFFAIGAGVIAVVLTASLYKIAALSSGGKTVAEALGGQLITQNTTDHNQRKLLNVVEEMAIASGIPVPPVYLLKNEPGINAFAAGFSPRDAVIGITEGAIEQLNREQLQGVIAHEFSHIFNGDMRLNLRLIGVLHGILIIGIIGYYILRSASYSGRRSRSDKGAGGILALGMGLVVIGFAGTFFGRLIKASVSRQREYLADASAVQFTRNPHGIAGALKKIGGFMAGSKIENPGAQEVSHAFFSEGVSTVLHFLLATHPPLADRIRRIEPNWDGKFDSSTVLPIQQEREEPATKGIKSQTDVKARMTAAVTGAAVIDAMGVIKQIGNPNQATIGYARALIDELPVTIKDAVREPYGARAVMYALVLHKPTDIRNKQLVYLQENADADVYTLLNKIVPLIENMDAKYQLPVIELAIPALKQLSMGQYQAFNRNLIALIRMDARINLFEWVLQKILHHNLNSHFYKKSAVKVRYTRLDQLKQECEVILSVLVYAGHDIQSNVEQAFAAANEQLDIPGLALLPKNRISLTILDLALEKLNQLKPLEKPRLLKACINCIAFDQHLAPAEVELLRAFSAALDCPMPPIS